jgi:hypothetical protein
MSRLRALLPSLLVLTASPALAGWPLTQVTTTSGGGVATAAATTAATTQRVWMEGAATRIGTLESAHAMIAPGSYVLVHDGGAKVFLVNPEQRTYARLDVGATTAGPSMPMGMKTATATVVVEDLWTAPAIAMAGSGRDFAGMGGSGGGIHRELQQLAREVKATLVGLPLRQVTVESTSAPAGSASMGSGIMGRNARRGWR